jgi:hypothetical protein
MVEFEVLALYQFAWTLWYVVMLGRLMVMMVW